MKAKVAQKSFPTAVTPPAPPKGTLLNRVEVVSPRPFLLQALPLRQQRTVPHE